MGLQLGLAGRTACAGSGCGCWERSVGLCCDERGGSRQEESGEMHGLVQINVPVEIKYQREIGDRYKDAIVSC